MRKDLSQTPCDTLNSKRGGSRDGLSCQMWLLDSSREVSRPKLPPWMAERLGRHQLMSISCHSRQPAGENHHHEPPESCSRHLFSGIWVVQCGSCSFQPHRPFSFQLAEWHWLATPGIKSPIQLWDSIKPLQTC